MRVVSVTAAATAETRGVSPLEQRVTCVLLVADAPHAPALPEATVEPLPNGAFALTFPEATAADQALRAGPTALTLRAQLPYAALVLVAGRGVATRDVVERHARLLRAARPGAVQLDAVAAALLDARFVVAGDQLVAERSVDEAPRRVCGRDTSFVGR